MATLNPLKLNLSASTAPAGRSLTSVFDVLGASNSLRNSVAGSFPDLFHAKFSGSVCDLTVDNLDLFMGEMVNEAALGADKISFSVKPSERYLELVAAISRDGNFSCDFDAHWPVLSVVGDTATVAEAGDCASVPGEVAL